ncbi:Dyp-type peroxidase [Nocardia sp. NBC_01503]|uniref:Dyp-type peroxidase n=1 Tax=Nocardia sp. NBC_01503 TaxID=2975997 RepID=UPI002E7AFFB3|nr:Dyp-type peroxidase [Nocardia sp. NBC_01503]WTL33658.1 Dyp-type peroxidase [Nocardia sp. NBC_01503]
MSGATTDRSNQSESPRVSRRGLFGSALVAAGAATAGAVAGRVTASGENTSRTVDFHGAQQAGIATTAQSHALFLSCDLARRDRGVLRDLLAAWTETAVALTAGDRVPDKPDSAPGFSDHTDFATGLDPARLTITFGLGPSVFDEWSGLTDRRPRHLATLPEFTGDQLRPGWTGGDIMAQICSDDPQIVSHAFRALRARMPGLGNLRWTQHGFLSRPVDGGTPRNMFGHKDGTANPRIGSAAFDEAVWVNAPEEPEWFHGGTYLVFRKIRMSTAEWDQLSRPEQDRIIGRRRDDGSPLNGTAETDPVDLDARAANGEPVIPADAHVRLVHGIPMLRRGYSYDYGTLVATSASQAEANAESVPEHTHPAGTEPDHTHSGHAQLDAGLLFAAYMNNPPEQFVKAQRLLSGSDRLNTVVQHTGSAIFAMPPGIAVGQPIGVGLGL